MLFKEYRIHVINISIICHLELKRANDEDIIKVPLQIHFRKGTALFKNILIGLFRVTVFTQLVTKDETHDRSHYTKYKHHKCCT